MAKFFPLYVRRSDGVLVVTARNGKREKNEPTPEQLNQTPDGNGVSDYYRLLSMRDAKYIDWMRKLGGMLIREIGGAENVGPDKAYLLYQLPENYRLYEHIKTKAQPKTTGADTASKAQKTHAGGNNERQDAYLYGHPLGRKKRYRSPGDFFPHLLWLATDPEGDPDNCPCKVCAPDELQPEEDRTKAEAIKRDEASKPEMQAHPVTEVSKGPATTATAGGLTGTQSTATQPSGRSLVPTVMASLQPRPIDQQIDSQYNRFIYRPGELVWYCKGAAWGLAIVARRFSLPPSPTAPATKGYLVQPLSLPLVHEQQVPVFSEEHMRPWLAWSPPGFTLQGLRSAPNVTLEGVDWQAAVSGRYGDGDPQVDASILAARAIDGSYTVFNPIPTNMTDKTAHSGHWNGIFVGAEKFWVGDPARLKPGTGRDVLVITDIIDTDQGSSTTQMRSNSSVHLFGDIYQPVEVPAGVPIPAEPNLPSRMREDMARRNAITLPTKHLQCYWKVISRQVRVGIDAIKGRWYEATLLTPILFSEDDYNGRVARGDIYEVGAMMNGRGDAQADPNRQTQLTRRATRAEAFGIAVPNNMAIVDGVEAPPDEELVRLQNRASAQLQQPQQTEMRFDDIMDFGGAGAG